MRQAMIRASDEHLGKPKHHSVERSLISQVGGLENACLPSSAWQSSSNPPQEKKRVYSAYQVALADPPDSRQRVVPASPPCAGPHHTFSSNTSNLGQP
jgi:hypothetical protein